MSNPEPQAEAPRRLRAADVIAEQRNVIAMLTQRGGGEHSAVTLSRNAKGATQIEVVVRTDDRDLTTAELARAEAERIYEHLCRRFPTETGYVRNEGQTNQGGEK